MLSLTLVHASRILQEEGQQSLLRMKAVLGLESIEANTVRLILTAIVISFGVVAFALVLFHRTFQTIGTDDPDAMHAGET